MKNAFGNIILLALLGSAPFVSAEPEAPKEFILGEFCENAIPQIIIRSEKIIGFKKSLI